MLRPELLANPEAFASFVDYLSSVSAPSGPYVPGAWAASFLSLYLVERQIDWVLAGLLLLSPASIYFVGEWCMQLFFFTGFSKAQESFGGHRTFSGKKLRKARGLFRTIAGKEAKQLLRDSSEWSQLFMIAALVIVYLYNFKVLPIDRNFWRQEYLANLIAFMNIGLTGFVIASLAARFVFTSTGAEGGSFYMIRSAPISLWRYLGYKFLYYSVPFLCLAAVLIVVSDFLLNIEGPALWISICTGSLITVTEVGLALGFGALYADFKAENRAAALGGIGVALYLLTSLAYMGVVLGSGALPAYRLTKRWLRDQILSSADIVLLGAWFIFAVIVSGALVYLVLRRGITRLEELS
jgi:ABC-2 type transport system permease protein